MASIFAVIKTGGKQYVISEGDILDIEKLASKDGEITFEEVLLYANDTKVSVGKPFVPGAKVIAKVLVEEGKGDKKIVFRYKNKTRRRKFKGHRQPFTRVQITKIAL